jgi:hypothetical protein
MKSAVDEPQYSLPGFSPHVGPDNCGEDLLTLTPERLEHLKKKKPSMLGLTCGRSECEKGLHSFRPKKIDTRKVGIEPCNSCGIEIMPAGTTLPRDLAQFDSTIALLNQEWIRHFFLEVPVTPRIERFALGLGKDGLIGKAAEHLAQKKMLVYMPALDYNQTKMLDGTIVHWARHALACCCRRCMAYWHGVPLTSQLSAEDICYFQQLIGLYVERKLPAVKGLGPQGSASSTHHDIDLKKAS